MGVCGINVHFFAIHASGLISDVVGSIFFSF